MRAASEVGLVRSCDDGESSCRLDVEVRAHLLDRQRTCRGERAASVDRHEERRMRGAVIREGHGLEERAAAGARILIPFNETKRRGRQAWVGRRRSVATFRCSRRDRMAIPSSGTASGSLRGRGVWHPAPGRRLAAVAARPRYGRPPRARRARAAAGASRAEARGEPRLGGPPAPQKGAKRRARARGGIILAGSRALD